MRDERTADYYALLELLPTASEAEIKKAWHEQLQVWHPDRFTHAPTLHEKAEARTKLINQAYQTLSDPTARARYDATVQPKAPPTAHTTQPPSSSPYASTPEASENFTEVQPFTGEMPEVPAVQLPAAPMLRSMTQYHTAVSVQKPRNLDKVVASVMREAEFAGDSFYYSYPMGGKKIEGASIGLAMAIAREWGNCAVPVEYYEIPTEWVFNAHFVDLERGFTVSRIFRRKKGKGLLAKLSDDRAEDMTFQAAQSRAIRNVVLAGVPRWLVWMPRITTSAPTWMPWLPPPNGSWLIC